MIVTTIDEISTFKAIKPTQSPNRHISQDRYPHLFASTPHTVFTLQDFEIVSDFIPVLLRDNKESQLTKSTNDYSCKSVAIIEEFLNLLKTKLKSETLNDRFSSSINTDDHVLADAGIQDFISKLYKSKIFTTTKKTTENDVLNSTSLVNLVEAVIFRNTGG